MTQHMVNLVNVSCAFKNAVYSVIVENSVSS